VLEDVQPFPIVATYLGVPGPPRPDYTLTNPGPNTLVLGGLGGSFESPIHDYNAIELTADKRLGTNWTIFASYRWSRLHGTYEGFYRDDNGQSDPGISSLYDFPTNDPSYTAIGAPQFGLQGRRSLPGRSRTGSAAARPAASDQGVRIVPAELLD